MFVRQALFLAAAAALALSGCVRADNRGETTPQVRPAAPREDVVVPRRQPQPEPANQTRLVYSYPDGWTARNLPRENRVVFEHDATGSIVQFTVWPTDRVSVYDYMNELWIRVASSSMDDEDVDVDPMQDVSQDGRPAYYFVSSRATASGSRVTYIWTGFQSNDPQVGVLMTGIWMSSLDAQMLQAFQAIGESIRIVTGEACDEGQTELDDFPNHGTVDLNTFHPINRAFLLGYTRADSIRR